MKNPASPWVFWLVVTGVVMAAVCENPLPLIGCGITALVVWNVGKGLR